MPTLGKPTLTQALERLERHIGALDHAEVVAQLLEQMPILMCIGNGTDWLFVSRPFSDLLGYDRQTLGATDHRTIIHPDDLEATTAATIEVLASGRPGQVTNRYRVRGTDRFRRLLWRWNPPGPNGYTVAVAEDLGDA